MEVDEEDATKVDYTSLPARGGDPVENTDSLDVLLVDGSAPEVDGTQQLLVRRKRGRPPGRKEVFARWYIIEIIYLAFMQMNFCHPTFVHRSTGLLQAWSARARNRSWHCITN